MDGVPANLANTLENKDVLERDRRAMRSRALCILLYHLGFSLSKAKTIISYLEQVSHEAIRKWYLKAKNIFSLKEGQRNAVALHENQ